MRTPSTHYYVESSGQAINMETHPKTLTEWLGTWPGLPQPGRALKDLG
jgi:hypothetical protein